MAEDCRKACKSCPFRRDNDLVNDGKPGGSIPEVYIGQAYGPFLLNCHKAPGYVQDAQKSPELTQCAGAAIFRANVQRDQLMPPQLLHVPADPETVFANAAEMLAHYRKVPLEVAQQQLDLETPETLMRREFAKVEVRRYDPQSTTFRK